MVDSTFCFNNEYYKQTFGMAMGNPISPVLSNLYMEFFEKYELSKILPQGIHWYRYVDDILCLWPTTHNHNVFLSDLNSLVPSIKFTLEIENNNILPFLDINIHRTERTFKFSIYRKPTNILQYVHYYSAGSLSTKISVFSSMFLRALRICSNEYINDEINFIKQLAINHQYPMYIINKSFLSAHKSFTRIEPRQNNNNFQNYLVLPYHVNFKNLPYILNKTYNISVAFKNTCSFKSLLINNAPKIDQGIVYNIPCKNCNKYYIGQSGKSLDFRIKQHKYNIRTANLNSALYVHLHNENHEIDFKNATVTTNVKNITNRHIIESALIKHNQDNIFNLCSSIYNLDNYIVNSIVTHITNSAHQSQ